MYAGGQGNNDQSLYKMSILEFYYTGSGYQIIEVPWVETQLVASNSMSNDDLFGDGIIDVYGRVGCPEAVIPDGANAGGGIDRTKCITTSIIQLPSMPQNSERFTGADRNYYHNKLTNNRTDVLDLLLSVTDGFNMTAEWDYAPLSSDADRPAVSFPLYATPTRADGDSMVRGGNGDVMEDYFLFTSSMYVVSSFKASNGVNATAQNTTWYGYEEAVFNNKGRGFQGFKAIHTEMHAPDDDVSAFELNPRTRSITIFRQDFPYAGLIACQYNVLASDGHEPATNCPTPMAQNPFATDIEPLTLTVNTWDLRDASDGVAGQSACNAGRSNEQGPVYLPFADSSISETRQMLNSTQLVSSTHTTTSIDHCGNVISQVRDVIDHGFYTLSSDTSNVYDYAQVDNNWWLDKTDFSFTTRSIVYDSNDQGMPDSADDLVGFDYEGGVRATAQSYLWNSSHRQPSCILQYEGSNDISCTNTPAGTWSRQIVTYDSYGNTATVTQTASNASTPRVTTTQFGGDGYFPTTISNALGQPTSTVFDPDTGNPTRITDANGLLTKFVYDAFGREIERYFPDDNGVAFDNPAEQYAPRTSTRYQWANCSNGDSCYSVKTITDGAPIVTETRDRLNRTIQTTRGGFNGVITTGQEYNGRGQVVAQSEPHYSSIPSSYGTTMSYDALGRVIHKSQDRDGGMTGELHSFYQHSGLHTRVRLTSTGSVPALGDPCANNTNGQLLCVDRFIGSQGQTLMTKDAAGELTMFWYDANLNPVLIEDADGNLTGANYNAFSQRGKLWDPNMGGISTSADMVFAYNGHGELLSQTDAKGQSTTFTYDILGRMLTRSAPDAIDAWMYDPAGAIGQLDRLQRDQNNQTVYARDFDYDAFARATGHITTINNSSTGQQIFELQVQPDGYFGRPVSTTYPTAFASLPLRSYHLYNKAGYLTREGDGRDYDESAPYSSPYYRKINAMSPRDQLVNVAYGNDAVDTWSHGPANGQMSTMVSSVPGLPEHLADLEYRYDAFGNLKLQTNHLLQAEERFIYDELQRLIDRIIEPIPEITPIEPTLSAPAPDPQPQPLTQSEAVSYSYDALGNIITKSDYAGNYQYNHVRHQICANGSLNHLATEPGPHAVTAVSAHIRSRDGSTSNVNYRMAYDANGNLICSEDGNLTVSYDAFNLPTAIQRGFITQNFNYGPDLQRYRQVMGPNTETLYIDKLYERKGNKERYYIGGYLVIERSSAGTDTHSYTHKDRLGSTVAITDGTGDVKVRQGFGPFGKARNSNWVATDYLPGANHDTRGFTDHEHLDNTRLIHMNGRAYDYNLGRFLSVDPIIQFPQNSQSLNPYSYLMNNPMAGTDPTGYSRVGLEAGSGSICGGNAGAGSCGNEGFDAPDERSSRSNGISKNPNVRAGIKAAIQAIEEIGDISERLNESPDRASKRGNLFSEFDKLLAGTDGAIFTAFFAAAAAVNGQTSVGSIDEGAPGDNLNELNESTEGVLNALGRFLFVFNERNFNFLVSGNDVPGLGGFTGSDLDQALVGFEQTLVQVFLNNFNTNPQLNSFVASNMSFDTSTNRFGPPGGVRIRDCCLPVPSRQDFINDVNSGFNGPITRLKIARFGGVAGKAFLKSVGASGFRGRGGKIFDFGQIEDRSNIGLNLVDEVSR